MAGSRSANATIEKAEQTSEERETERSGGSLALLLQTTQRVIGHLSLV